MATGILEVPLNYCIILYLSERVRKAVKSKRNVGYFTIRNYKTEFVWSEGSSPQKADSKALPENV